MHAYETAPAEELFSVTVSDSTKYSPPLRGVYIGTGGNIAIKTRAQADAVTLTNVVAGTVLPIKAEMIMSTGTTASGIVGLR